MQQHDRQLHLSAVRDCQVLDIRVVGGESAVGYLNDQGTVSKLSLIKVSLAATLTLLFAG